MSEAETQRILRELEELKEAQQTTPRQKMWDLALRAMIPIVMIAGTTLIVHEVRISANERKLEGLPPKWLTDAFAEIKEGQHQLEMGQRDISRRLTIVETKVDPK